jgi:hypothetical protein
MLAIEKRWARVVLSSFAGSSEGFVPDDDVDYVDAALMFTGAGSEKAALGLRVAVLMVITAPLWAWGRLRRLSSLPAEERSRLMDELLRHRFFFVREMCLLLKLVCCMAIFRSAEARARSGYERPVRGLRVIEVEAA